MNCLEMMPSPLRKVHLIGTVLWTLLRYFFYTYLISPSPLSAGRPCVRVPALTILFISYEI